MWRLHECIIMIKDMFKNLELWLWRILFTHYTPYNSKVFPNPGRSWCIECGLQISILYLELLTSLGVQSGCRTDFFQLIGRAV
ncbi:hypothetical protein V5799_016012 [Amblyomma americanum]|uniref:Uncharacterized protein n=1 Tax=Amblyomma americanum TaxID=6943 RepID=A0AAQ4F7D2_AMBAM